MDELVKEFVLDDETTNAEGSVYFGRIGDTRAILIFPKQPVPRNVLPEILSLSRDPVQANDVYRSYRVAVSMDVQFRMIYPATDAHMRKYLAKDTYAREGYEEYLRFMDSDSYVRSNWIQNLVESPADVSECVLYSNEEVLIVPDYKWDRQSNDHIHLLAIFKDPELRTVRDIDDHAILARAHTSIEDVLSNFGLCVGDVFMFFHYRPTYFRLHLHILNIKMSHEGLASAVRAIPLYDVMRNLQIDPDYYRRDLFTLTKIQ